MIPQARQQKAEGSIFPIGRGRRRRGQAQPRADRDQPPMRQFADECALRLGNMCLADSDLIITKHVSESSSWDRDAVSKRQIWLAVQAVAVGAIQ